MSGGHVADDRRLRAEWTAVAVVAVAVALAGRWFVAGESAAAADRWVVVASAVLAYQVGFLQFHLVRGPGTGTSLGVPTAVTLWRGMCFAATAGFLVVSPSTLALEWTPAVCYGAGAALDAVDGFVARRLGETSALGARLDHAFDTLGFLVAPLVGVAWGRLPVWYLALSAARYCFRGGVWWRERAGRPVRPLPESRVRRPLAAFQMAFITVALTPVVPAGVVHAAATVAVAPSLAVFVRDYLAVTGRLDAGGPGR